MTSLKYSVSPIIYHKGNIVEHLVNFISSKNRHGYDLVVPQCFFLKSKSYSLLTKNILKNFPTLTTNLEMFICDSKNYGHTQFVSLDNKHNKNLNKIIFANMLCAKYKSSKRKIDYISLAKCMSNISSFISHRLSNTENDGIQIISSKFGTGFFGGNWSFIEQLVNDSWGCYTTNIYTYEQI